jgi:hypothetical protein
VIVDLSEGHHSHHWMAGGIVTTLDQQDPLRLRLQLMYAAQESGRRRVPQPLIDNDERRGAGRSLGTQPVQRGICRCRRRYRVVRSEAVGDVVDELLPDNLITGHDKNQRRRAARRALILCTQCPEMAPTYGEDHDRRISRDWRVRSSRR